MKTTLALLALLFSFATNAAEWKAARATQPPQLDGDLSDAVWQSAPEIAGFTQHDPDDGKPATEETIVKILYDDNAVYIGALMKDSHAVTTLLGRRDNSLESDWFRIYIDAQHDRLSGAEFWINPSNVQVDGILYNDLYDDWSWDGVWESAAKIVPGIGWIAEVRIPYSQLRFSDAPQQTWGVNFIRRICRRKEVDRLANTLKTESGFVSRFADLGGIEGIHPTRSFELAPYAVARSDVRSRFDRLDPFARQQQAKMEGGVDLKYGLSSSLTLTGTINPDFGQVEVDPAVVNLSTFETFFPEKRPFFTEGAQWFKFGSGPANSRWNFNLFAPSLFYSRRIGRSPQGTGNISADYVTAPGDTTILGAAKLSGKIGNGWAVGVLDAVTNRESARFVSGGAFHSEQVEPMTNYLTGRMSKEFDKGNSRLGFMFTAVNRDVPQELSYLRSGAYTAGVDGYKLFDDKTWLLEWLVAGSMVKGSAAAIDATQTSSAHYFQRPDAHYGYDPTRTSLTGTGARIMLNKQTGKWRTNLQAQTYSPGFETNDAGFMPRADITAVHAVGYYINEDVRKHFRDTELWAGRYMNWNRAGDTIANGLYGNWYVETINYWYAFRNFGWSANAWDDRRTRGGPLARRPGTRSGGIGIGSDSRKKLSFEASANDWIANDGSYDRSATILLNYRPSAGLRLSLGPTFDRAHDAAQYVTTTDDSHYVFSKIEQHTIDIATRVEWTASSRLSFQLYMQPFIATGDYHDFSELARARSGDYAAYSGAVDNPDFDFHSVRGSSVVRWEFRPGSALYVVWNENRADTLVRGDFRLRRDLRAIANAQSRDVFLVKLSYWLPM